MWPRSDQNHQTPPARRKAAHARWALELIEGRPNVAVLCLQLVEHSVDSSRRWLRLLREREEVLRVAPPHRLVRPSTPQPLEGVLVDRFEHPEAPAVLADEALFHQRLKRVEVGVETSSTASSVAAAGEDAEPRRAVARLR